MFITTDSPAVMIGKKEKKMDKPNVNEEVLKQVEAYVQDKYAFNESEFNRMKKAMNEAQFAFLATLAALEAYNKPLADVLKAEAIRCGWRIR